MKQLRWSPSAANDLEGIFEYLEQHHPSFTRTTIQRLYDAARSLREHPFLGREGRKPATRELVLSPLPYVLDYPVSEEFVHILRFPHTSQDWQ